MNETQIVQAWKNQHMSDSNNNFAPANPAGPIVVPEELIDMNGAGKFPKLSAVTAILTSMPCIGVASSTLSCIVCDETIWNGTCGAMSVGCCGQGATGEA